MATLHAPKRKQLLPLIVFQRLKRFSQPTFYLVKERIV